MMKSLLKKRLPGILAAGIAMLAVGAAGAAPAAASSDFGVSAFDTKVNISKAATTSRLTVAQRRARARSLRACQKRRNVRQRRLCIRRVNQRFARIARRQQRRPNRPRPAPTGQTHRVMVQDPYSYSPNQVNIKVNDSILWDWSSSMGREPHDVTPSAPWPAGVNRNQFKSALMTGPNATFKRQFTQPGTYAFVCSIHHLMTMNVRVTR